MNFNCLVEREIGNEWTYRSFFETSFSVESSVDFSVALAFRFRSRTLYPRVFKIFFRSDSGKRAMTNSKIGIVPSTL